MHDNKFKKYTKQKVNNRNSLTNGEVIPEEEEFARGNGDNTTRSMDIELNIQNMNQTLGKFTKTFYSYRSMEPNALKNLYARDSNIQLEHLTNSLKSSKEKKTSGEIENKMNLFAENGQLKPDIAKTVVNKESDS